MLQMLQLFFTLLLRTYGNCNTTTEYESGAREWCTIWLRRENRCYDTGHNHVDEGQEASQARMEVGPYSY